MGWSIRGFGFNKVAGALRRHAGLWLGLAMVGVVVVAAIFASFIAPYPENKMDIFNNLAPPSSQHLLGTDNYGRDILTQVIYGSRISLEVGFSSVLLTALIGATLGLLAGYFGGPLDMLVMRVSDIVLSFPIILLALALVGALGPSAENVVIALALAYWTSYARLVRATTLSVKEELYVEAARALGAGHGRIMLRHLLPNIAGPIVVLATLGVGAAIVAEASLDFLGLGVQPSTASWGLMTADGLRFLSQDSNLSTFAGIAIMWTVLGFNLVGDGLTDRLNPKLARR
ncbi:MAG TPA: ABC transporter permease [Chloroflexota bacterium]|jgi:peptide/nickel transport system permease protein